MILLICSSPVLSKESLQKSISNFRNKDLPNSYFSNLLKNVFLFNNPSIILCMFLFSKIKLFGLFSSISF